MRRLEPTSSRFGRITRELLRQGHGIRFRARGSSMLPFIRDGDILVIRPLGPSGIFAGDVVFFERPGGGLVAHTVLRTAPGNGETMVEVQGDNVGGRAERVASGAVLGRVTGIRRNGRDISLGRWWWRAQSVLTAGPRCLPSFLRWLLRRIAS